MKQREITFDCEKKVNDDPWGNMLIGLKLFTDDFLMEPIEDQPPEERETEKG